MNHIVNYNLHTHTYRCNHASGTDEEYVLASPNQNFYDGNYKQLSTNGILKFK